MADLEPFGDYLVMPCGCLVRDDAEALEHAAGCGICAGQVLAIFGEQNGGTE